MNSIASASRSFNANYFSTIFTFSPHTQYVKRESIVIAWAKKKKFLLLTNVYDFYVLEDKTSLKKFPPVCLSGCLDVWMYVRTWTFHVDTITFEGVSGSKQNLVDIFSIWRITFSNEFHSEILILILKKKKNSKKRLRNKTKFHEYH